MTYDNFTPSAPSLTAVLGECFSSQDALKLIMQNEETYQRFLLFPERVQQKLLAFIEGQRGLKITYDTVEMQKLGLYFPGERSNCYAADAIMRQYSELKSRLKNKFSYKMMKPFILIILMEHSSATFKKVSPHYIHNEQTSYDSGAEVTSLIKTKYISLDTFRNYVHNIDNKLHAWLTFFSSDEPADILKLVTAYPEFCELYQEIAQFRTKPEELIYMYSEALAIADRNTIRLMIDDMQEELASLTNQVAAKSDELAIKKDELAAKEDELAAKENEIAAKEDELAAKENEIAAKENEIARLRAENEKLKSSRQ